MNLLDRLAYDSGGYTVQEILSSFCKKIIEIIDLVNKNEEVCDETHAIIENIRNEVVPDLVNDIIKEMQDNGYFDNLVNVTLIEQLRTEFSTLLNQTITDYTTRLDNFKTQLDENKNEIINLDNTVEKIKNNNIKFKENFLLKRNPYGTYENASSFSVVTNSDNKVQVLGISTEKDELLATYDNRDIVGIYNSVSTNKDNIFVFENCNFTQYTVTIPSNYKLENIKEGMIIDTSHSPKFSAIIREINKDTNVITVYNWYQMGNESLGQIPTGGTTIKINNVTKIWNINTNLFLNEGDYNTAGCGYEMDIINHQPHTDNIDGIDIVLAGTYGAHRGYVARGKNNLKWTYGFYGDNCDTGYYIDNNNIGFRALNSNLFGFLSNNSEIGFCSKGDKSKPALQCEQNSKVFTISNEGKMSSLGLNYVHAKPNTTTNVDVYNTPFVLMSGNIKLNSPSECTCKMLFVHNIGNEQYSITANMKKGNSAMTGLPVPSGKTVVLYCDGSIFYVLDFNLS